MPLLFEKQRGFEKQDLLRFSLQGVLLLQNRLRTVKLSRFDQSVDDSLQLGERQFPPNDLTRKQ